MSSHDLLKGSLGYFGTQTNLAQPVVFQFNPDTITRLHVYSGQANVLTESIRFTLVLNAMEGLEQEVPEVVANGIYPQLAALEVVFAQQTTQQRARGWPDWLFPTRNAHFLALIYGERIIPVKIQRLNMKEVLHNNRLNPLHATVDVALRVLTENDLRGNTIGLGVLAAYKRYRQLKAQLTETPIL